MIDTLYLTKNDLQPYYRVKVENQDGSPLTPSLAGATIYFTMKNMVDDTIKINRNSANISIIDPVNWIFEFQWQPGHTDTPGIFNIEFEINPIGAGKFTIPYREFGQAIVDIKDSLDTI